jgi:hypothetical protein
MMFVLHIGHRENFQMKQKKIFSGFRCHLLLYCYITTLFYVLSFLSILCGIYLTDDINC